MVQAVIWDIGGVLVRTEDRRPRTHLAERFGMSYDEMEMLVFGGDTGRRGQLGMITWEQIWEHVAQELKISPHEIPAIRDEFFGGDRLDSELIDYIRSLHTQFRTGIITNGYGWVRTVIREEWQMADAFDTIVISAEEGVMKPAALIFETALQRLGVLPEEALFVDDAMPNVEGARAVGMRAVHFRSPAQTLHQLNILLELQA